MKKIIAFGMILSMICNSGTLRVEAEPSCTNGASCFSSGIGAYGKCY